MLLAPVLLRANHLGDEGFVRDQLRLLLLKVANVVSKEVIGNDEGFEAFGTLLPCVRDAV